MIWKKISLKSGSQKKKKKKKKKNKKLKIISEISINLFSWIKENKDVKGFGHKTHKELTF